MTAYNYLHNRQLLIAIDGTQKFYRNYQWDPDNPGLIRTVGKEKTEQHYVYVLESVIILDNGITLPFLSEFLSAEDTDEDPELSSNENKPATDEDKIKQDSERKAFRRLATKIKGLFRNTRIAIVADGLYACGSIIQICVKNNWDYMITLKPGAMPALWEDAQAIMNFDEEARHKVMWGDRTQHYFWANDIEYDFEKNNVTRRLRLKCFFVDIFKILYFLLFLLIFYSFQCSNLGFGLFNITDLIIVTILSPKFNYSFIYYIKDSKRVQQ